MNGASLDRRWWGGAVLACLAAVLAALAMPVPLPDGSGAADSLSGLPEDTAKPAPEDLRAFMDSRRWGASLREILEAQAEKARQAKPEQLAVNPVLANMGFVGLIVTADRNDVLLQAPEGGVARFAPGDTLPDGRTLVSITDNALTLKAADSSEEVLTLFPRVLPDQGAAGPESASR